MNIAHSIAIRLRALWNEASIAEVLLVSTVTDIEIKQRQYACWMERQADNRIQALMLRAGQRPLSYGIAQRDVERLC
jgi:hypothetical protein